MLKRIAEDRKSQQEKMQAGASSEKSPPSGQEQKLGGKVQTNVDNNCLLMVKLQTIKTHTADSSNLTCIFFRRFGCRRASPCASASLLTLLYAASWSTSPGAIPPCRPFLSCRVSPGSASERRSSRVRCAPSASHQTRRCAFRPLLRKRRTRRAVLQTLPRRGRALRLRARRLHSRVSLSRRELKGRTRLCLLHFQTSCGKKQ